MILSFYDQGTEDIFNGRQSKKARKCLPPRLYQKAQDKLDRWELAHALEDLSVPPGNMLESLKGDRKGQHSIRINQQYRVCFVWTPAGPERVEIVDYH